MNIIIEKDSGELLLVHEDSIIYNHINPKINHFPVTDYDLKPIIESELEVTFLPDKVYLIPQDRAKLIKKTLVDIINKNK